MSGMMVPPQQHAPRSTQLSDTADPQPELQPIAYVVPAKIPSYVKDPLERRRYAEYPWDIWCRICLLHVGWDRTYEYAVETADNHVFLKHTSLDEVHRLLAAVAAGRIVVPESLDRAGLERWGNHWDRLNRKWTAMDTTTPEPWTESEVGT
jgi:hypothetical protein